MKLAQVVDGSSSAAAIQEGGGFRLIPGHTVESLLEAAQEEGVPLADFAARHAGERVDHARIEIPVRPRGGLGLRLHLCAERRFPGR